MLCLIPNKDDELSLAILQKNICIELNRKNIIFLPLYPLWVKFFIQYDSLLKKNIKNILINNISVEEQDMLFSKSIATGFNTPYFDSRSVGVYDSRVNDESNNFLTVCNTKYHTGPSTRIKNEYDYLTIPIILELLDSKTIDGKIILGKLKASDENSSTLNTFILQFLQDKKIANFRTFRIANATFYDDISWQVEKSYWVKLHS